MSDMQRHRTSPTREDVLELVRQANSKGMTIPEVVRAYPKASVQAVRSVCRSLLDERKLHREGDKRPGVSGTKCSAAWVMRLGTHPEGKDVRRPRVPASASMPLLRLLRDLDKAINQRDLEGKKAAYFSRVIREQLARRGVSCEKAE